MENINTVVIHWLLGAGCFLLGFLCCAVLSASKRSDDGLNDYLPHFRGEGRPSRHGFLQGRLPVRYIMNNQNRGATR